MMKLKTLFSSFSIVFLLGMGILSQVHKNSENTGAPPGGIPESEAPAMTLYDYFRQWKRPDGPARVGIQVGHWKNNELPDELDSLRGNTGAIAGGVTETEVNLEIASLMKEMLEQHGVEVDLIPATVPPSYVADLFIAIHADGSEDTSTTGYKFAGPWRDFTGKGDSILSLLSAKYAAATKLAFDQNITQNMRGYYAFSWWKNVHAVHPMTPSVIAETGFLTNRNDRSLLVNSPEVPAKAMADAILEYLRSEELI